MIRDDFITVIQTTADIAEVDVSAMLSGCRELEVVEARCIAVKLLNTMGYSLQRIARYFHKTDEGIRKLISSYDDRVRTNKLISRMVKEITKKLPTNYQLITN